MTASLCNYVVYRQCPAQFSIAHEKHKASTRQHQSAAEEATIITTTYRVQVVDSGSEGLPVPRQKKSTTTSRYTYQVPGSLQLPGNDNPWSCIVAVTVVIVYLLLLWLLISFFDWDGQWFFSAGCSLLFRALQGAAWEGKSPLAVLGPSAKVRPWWIWGLRSSWYVVRRMLLWWKYAEI